MAEPRPINPFRSRWEDPPVRHDVLRGQKVLGELKEWLAGCWDDVMVLFGYRHRPHPIFAALRAALVPTLIFLAVVSVCASWVGLGFWYTKKIKADRKETVDKCQAMRLLLIKAHLVVGEYAATLKLITPDQPEYQLVLEKHCQLCVLEQQVIVWAVIAIEEAKKRWARHDEVEAEIELFNATLNANLSLTNRATTTSHTHQS